MFDNNWSAARAWDRWVFVYICNEETRPAPFSCLREIILLTKIHLIYHELHFAHGRRLKIEWEALFSYHCLYIHPPTGFWKHYHQGEVFNLYYNFFLCGLCDTDQIITPDWANMKSVENCGRNRWQSLRYYTALVYTVYFAVSCLKIERKDMSGYC